MEDARTVARDVVVASYLGWTLDAFDFFIMIFAFAGVAHTFQVSGLTVTPLGSPLTSILTGPVKPPVRLRWTNHAVREPRRTEEKHPNHHAKPLVYWPCLAARVPDIPIQAIAEQRHVGQVGAVVRCSTLSPVKINNLVLGKPGLESNPQQSTF